MEFPDVSSFPRHSPYRGYGGWPFGNRIHHLMRSFHPSDTNIAEGSIFLPPWREKISENFSDLYSRLSPTPSKGRSLRYVLCYEANRAESMAVGDFGAPLCCARNDSSTRAVVL